MAMKEQSNSQRQQQDTLSIDNYDEQDEADINLADTISIDKSQTLSHTDQLVNTASRDIGTHYQNSKSPIKNFAKQAKIGNSTLNTQNIPRS